VDTLLPCLAAVRDKAVQGTITDFSLDGCRCILPTHLPEGILHLHLGDIILIETQLGGSSVRLQGRLRNVSVQHASARIGVRFEPLPPEVEQQVVAFLMAQEGEG
jgi:c-di-GMP-binding flagellar brake protein YcgR